MNMLITVKAAIAILLVTEAEPPVMPQAPESEKPEAVEPQEQNCIVVPYSDILESKFSSESGVLISTVVRTVGEVCSFEVPLRLV